MWRARVGSTGLFLFSLTCAAAAAEPDSKAVRNGPLPLAAGQDQKVEILAYDNGDASPWAEFFIFDSPGHPKLVRLRTEYGLEDVVKGAKTDLQRAVALKRWVGAHWKFTTPGPEAFCDWSAVALLDRAKQGNFGWCGQAAMIFQQACMTVGLPVRFIELGQPTSPACHFTTEVYLREHGKWAVVDATPLPEADLYYTAGGVPQSALEMHRRVVAGKMDDIIQVHSDREQKVENRGQFAWGFYYVRWLTRCDIVTNTPKFVDMENTFDRRWHTVDWVDADTVPWEKQKNPTYYVRNERLSAWTTSDPEVMYWAPTDRVRMDVRADAKHVFFHLWSAELDFDYFEVAVDGGDWQRLPDGNINTEPQYGWSAKRFSIPASGGVHEARVRLVRRVGTKGPESFVKLRLKPKE
jgi:hypothetical protein